EAIWIKRVRRGPMDAVDTAVLVQDRGIVGNANQGGRRQVTVSEAEAWQTTVNELDADLSPSARRPNPKVSGIRLAQTRGCILEIGDVRLDVYGETRPCERMDEALDGLRDTMKPDWRGGVFATVLVGGEIRVGDPVLLRSGTRDEQAAGA